MNAINQEGYIWEKAESSFVIKAKSLLQYIKRKLPKTFIMDNYNNNDLIKILNDNDLEKVLKIYASKQYLDNFQVIPPKKEITLTKAIKNKLRNIKRKKSDEVNNNSKNISINLDKINIELNNKQKSKLKNIWLCYLNKIKPVTDSESITKSINDIAQIFQTRQISQKELIYPGYIGMLKSIPYYDYYNKNSFFKTYSSFFIKIEMKNYIISQNIDPVPTEDPEPSGNCIDKDEMSHYIIAQTKGTGKIVKPETFEMSPELAIINSENQKEIEVKKIELKKALKKLSKRQNFIVKKKLFKNNTYVQIADEIGVSVNTVRREYEKAINELSFYISD